MRYCFVVAALCGAGMAWAGTATYQGDHTGSDIQISASNAVSGLPDFLPTYTGTEIVFSRAAGIGLAQTAAATGSGNLSLTDDFVFEVVVNDATIASDNDGVGIMLDAGSNNANTIFLAISNDNGDVGLYRANGAIDNNVERAAEGTLVFPVTLRLTRSGTSVTIEGEDAAKALFSFTAATLSNATVEQTLEFLDFGAGGSGNSMSINVATVTGASVPDINSGSGPPPAPDPIPEVPTGTPIEGGAALALLTLAVGGLAVRRARARK